MLQRAAAGNQQTASEQGRTFKLLEVETSFVKEDGGVKTVAGSVFMLHSALKTLDGKATGVADFTCTDLSTGPKGVFHCNGTDTFTDQHNRVGRTREDHVTRLHRHR